MPTAHSWTELGRGLRDVGWLLALRRSGLNARAQLRLRLAAALVLMLTVAVVVVPALLREPLGQRRAADLVALLPSLYLGFAVLAALAAIGSGGGREVVPREQLVAYPLSSVAEHFTALLLAPLNVSWLLQAWTLLAATTYLTGPENLLLVTVPVLLWIAVATALGQCVGWLFEAVRRGPHGTTAARAWVLVLGGLTVLGAMTGRLTDLLDSSPTVYVYLAAGDAAAGNWASWSLAVLALLVGLVLLVLAGLVPARWALSRPLREEVRLESGIRLARTDPRSDLGALLRTDRASIWRAVPLRRGLMVLGVMPGAVALAGALAWDLVTVLPGLVASGGALLFGVNAWCLEGRGALWRESLPVDPRLSFLAKAIVAFEVLVVSAGATIVLAALRAGTPTATEVAAVITATLVVSLQVVATSMRWSVSRPFAVDLRSARATPAPPVVMVGYSSRLAVKTTLVGLVFAVSARGPDWQLPLLIGVPFACWSLYRLVQSARVWDTPQCRSRVVTVVAS